MYTDAMRMAFRSVSAPENFAINIIDNEFFLNIKLSEQDFSRLNYDGKVEALQYIARVKHALEDNGAIVLVTRGSVGGK